MPCIEHRCTPLPLHWVELGAHTTHMPLRQTGVPPVHDVWFIH